MQYTKPQFPVDTAVPVPTPRAKRLEYPFGSLDVGNSYAFPSVDALKHRNAAAVFRHRQTEKGKTWDYTCQKVEGTDQHRLWRTA